MTVFSDENINTLIYIYTSRYSLSLTDLLVNMAAMTRDVTIPTKPDLKITTNRSHGVQNKVGGAFKDLRNQKIIKCVV